MASASEEPTFKIDGEYFYPLTVEGGECVNQVMKCGDNSSFMNLTLVTLAETSPDVAGVLNACLSAENGHFQDKYLPEIIVWMSGNPEDNHREQDQVLCALRDTFASRYKDRTMDIQEGIFPPQKMVPAFLHPNSRLRQTTRFVQFRSINPPIEDKYVYGGNAGGSLTPQESMGIMPPVRHEPVIQSLDFDHSKCPKLVEHIKNHDITGLSTADKDRSPLMRILWMPHNPARYLEMMQDVRDSPLKNRIVFRSSSPDPVVRARSIELLKCIRESWVRDSETQHLNIPDMISILNTSLVWVRQGRHRSMAGSLLRETSKYKWFHLDKSKFVRTDQYGCKIDPLVAAVMEAQKAPKRSGGGNGRDKKKRSNKVSSRSLYNSYSSAATSSATTSQSGSMVISAPVINAAATPPVWAPFSGQPMFVSAQ